MRQRPDQPDLFLDIMPAKRRRGRPRKQEAEIVAFPLTRDQKAVRQMASLMAAMPKEDRNTFWRKHTRRLIREKQDAGLPYKAAYAAVFEYTLAVRRLARYLEADPAARLGGGGV